MSISQSDLQSWIVEQNSNRPQVHVSEPEYHKGGMMSKAYLDFLFTVTPVNGAPYSSRHRFSEVEAVRQKLKESYMKFGLLVPATPSKGLLQNSADINNTFSKERMRGLILFCDHVFSCPFLANDSTWLSFMGGSVSGSNVGLNMLTSALSYVDQPFKFTIVSRIASVKAEVECVEASMKAQLSSLRAIQSADKNLKLAHDSLHDALSTSVAHETVTLKCFNGYPFDAPESIVNPPELLVKHSSACYDGLNLATAVCGAAPDEVMNIVLIPAVEHELYQMGAFREMLKIHDDMMIAHGSIIIKLEKEAMGQNQSKIDDYKAKLIIAENDRSNFYKGLIYFTLPMHARHRGHAFRTAYSGMAAVTLMEASQAHTASLEFFSKMQVHPNTAADHCNTVLSSLKMGALNSTQMDLGRGATNFFDANIPVRPLLEGLFEAAISGDYGPLQTTNSSAPPAPPASFAPRCGENFSDNEDNNDRIPTEFAGASVQDTQGEWQGGGGESVGI